MVAGNYKLTRFRPVLRFPLFRDVINDDFFVGQVIGGIVIVIMLPLVSLTTQPASYVFTAFEMSPESTGISSKPYAVVLALLVSQYSLYGYDAAAHLTEETRGADRNGPIAILSSLGIILVFGWAYILALTFSIQVFPMKIGTLVEWGL